MEETVAPDQLSGRNRFQVGLILKKPGGERVELKVIDDTEIVKVPKPRVRRGKVRPGGVKKVGKDKWMVDERQLTGSTENLNQLLTQARALPYLENGKTAGFRLSEIVPGSMFEKIGLLNGDVIKRVKAQDLNKELKYSMDLENFEKSKEEINQEFNKANESAGKGKRKKTLCVLSASAVNMIIKMPVQIMVAVATPRLLTPFAFLYRL